MRRYRKPHRARKKKPIFKNRFFWIGGSVAIILIILVYWVFFSDFFRIENISVSGQNKLSREDIKELVEEEINKNFGFLPSRNILLVNDESIEKRVSETFPLVGFVDVQKDLPRHLSATIRERTPEAKICRYVTKEESMREEECFNLDKKGVIFEVAQKGELLLKLSQDEEQNEWLLGEEVVGPELLLRIREISARLKDSEVYPQEIVIVSSERINVITSEGWRIFFDPQEDLEWQLAKLKAVLDEYITPEERKELDYIDLRFGNLAPIKKKGE
ncbi:MAG: FtsQ-type POTRA domain-containing protein [Candidatus Nealsonbacteria bacterium]|nr:FtsQ-type POTRA domain-containing protein [Candidatus Nealsonbacteria bacterium]